MKLLKNYILFYLVAILVTDAMAQGTYTPPKVSARYTKDLQTAVLQAQSGQVEPAITTIKEIIVKNPGWTEPHQELARIYYDHKQTDQAIAQLETTLRIDTLSQLQQLYTLGRMYEEANTPDKAIGCYQAVIRKGIHHNALAQKATASLQSLEEKNMLWGSSYTIDLLPFDEDINTVHHEVLGRWTLDGQQMIFTRFLFEQEDIFFASFDSVARLWRIEDFPHNTPQNEGALAISPDGNYLIFTSCNRQDGMGSCDLYLSFIHEGKWAKPTNMGPAFNSPAWDGQPCFGLDGLSLFFSSSRTGGYGGRDIWYVQQIGPGKWSRPINAGPAINTADNEESPFVHFDGQTIYFMRDGKKGLGGYDLYMARKGNDGKWQDADNMGAPINSGADEGALTLHPDGQQAIITRQTKEQKNDLFVFTLPEKFRASTLQALDVTITDEATHKPVRARLEVFENDRKDTVRISQWADNEGKITVALRRGQSYGIIASADGYVMHSAQLLPDHSVLRQFDIRMTAIVAAAEKVMVLENIFFETASSALLPSSDPELNKLLWSLRENPLMQIEIRGHTDNTGDEASNQKLSEARAKSVHDFLTGRGIEASRLSYIGFGETMPLADNTTEEGRKKNRRTEFRITNKE